MSVSTVIETALLFAIDALANLHIIEVADFHSDASHPVFPIRVDGDFSSPKSDPNTITDIDPGNAVSHSHRKEASKAAGHNAASKCSKKAGMWTRDGPTAAVLKRDWHHLC
jgi:hypothetical protein